MAIESLSTYIEGLSFCVGSFCGIKSNPGNVGFGRMSAWTDSEIQFDIAKSDQ